ncbi:hypothetical protein EDB83DRAFT_1559246 [Lactarius deliciosus]|nr:hypothetical protein EDB83DRAFT_1559246 [Lactarius deliciosus]
MGKIYRNLKHQARRATCRSIAACLVTYSIRDAGPAPVSTGNRDKNKFVCRPGDKWNVLVEARVPRPAGREGTNFTSPPRTLLPLFLGCFPLGVVYIVTAECLTCCSVFFFYVFLYPSANFSRSVDVTLTFSSCCFGSHSQSSRSFPTQVVDEFTRWAQSYCTGSSPSMTVRVSKSFQFARICPFIYTTIPTLHFLSPFRL